MRELRIFMKWKPQYRQLVAESGRIVPPRVGLGEVGHQTTKGRKACKIL